MVGGLYGPGGTAYVGHMVFVGGARPEGGGDPRLLRALFLAGVATSAIAVVERLFVTPEVLVLLGTARYVQGFLGATAVTAGNVYGLPGNYWAHIGGGPVAPGGAAAPSCPRAPAP